MYYLTKEWTYLEETFLKEGQLAGLAVERLQLGENVIDQAFKRGFSRESVQMTDLVLPDFWEISVNFEIFDGDQLKGQIMPLSPTNQKVEYVRWLTEEGRLFARDVYDGLTKRYKQEIWIGEDPQLVQTNYFDPWGRERLQIFHEQEKVLYRKNAGQEQGFGSIQEAETYFLEGLLDQEESILMSNLTLFKSLESRWQKKVIFYLDSLLEEEDLQELMLRSKKVLTRNQLVMERYQDSGRLTYLPYLKGKNKPFRPHCLIMTNTQDLEQIETLVKALPDMHFHIGALTNMGPALLALESYKNVHLYPNMMDYRYEALLDYCSLYLDLAYANEVLEVNRLALAHGLLLYSFRETCHRPEFYPENHLFEAKEVENLINCLKQLENSKAYQVAQERLAQMPILGSDVTVRHLFLD